HSLYPKRIVSDPCIYTKCVAKEKCRVVNGKAECQPIGGAVCWASGDPHYSTFDGQKYDFQGTCKYTIAKTCGTETSLPSFKVEAKNANRGSTKVSYVDLVNIYVYDLNITVLRREHSLVRVNDLKSNLPLLLHDGKLK
uniref:VWFD domain-containing protein n=1 Tax=Callorhinchus milii TaxID=7868 RepID=A0A4W3HDB9_CALMI